MGLSYIKILPFISKKCASTCNLNELFVPDQIGGKNIGNSCFLFTSSMYLICNGTFNRARGRFSASFTV